MNSPHTTRIESNRPWLADWLLEYTPKLAQLVKETAKLIFRLYLLLRFLFPGGLPGTSADEGPALAASEQITEALR